jgi:RNA polymerase sigma-70 factor (ECF subfamily)
VTDLELVSRARSGDTAAFGELVERHRTAVFRAALAALGSPSEAEDVAQEACVLAFRKLASFRGDASFKTWLLAIAWRSALTRRRTLAGWLQSLRGLPGGCGESNDPGARDGAFEGQAQSASGAAAPTPEQAVLQRERMQAVTAAVRGLPTKLRDCLLLAGSGEYSYDVIASIVEAPVGTVKWRVSEARRQVRARLVRRGFEI